MLKKSLVTAVLALTVAWAAPASALVITFDPTGTAGPSGNLSIDVLDPTVGNSLAQGASLTSTVGSNIVSLFQANLGVATLGGVTQFANGDGGHFFTVVAGFNETVLSNSGGTFPTVVLGLNGALPSFFDVYATPTTANNLAGTGFVGANPPILSGVFINSGAPSDGITTFTYSGTGAPLDGFGNNDYPAITTFTGGGSFRTTVLVTGVNTNYFPDLQLGTTLALVTSQLTLNYTQVDPSACFSTNGTTGCNTAGATLASISSNNGNGPNEVFQTDASAAFVAAANVPEPATLTLLGFGLVAGARRRMKNKK